MDKVLKKPRVFVIDDNPADLVMARLLLNKEGCEPVLFDDQVLALKILAAGEVPDLILLDIEMPGLSGTDCLKRIRRQPRLQQVPVIMVTGKSDAADVRLAISCGANDYIIKPLDPDIFRTKLSRFVVKAGRSQEEWIEYMMGQTGEGSVQLQVDAKVISIGEVSVTLQTNSALPLNFNFYVRLPFLKELDIQILPLSVLSCAEDGDFYSSKCNIIGLPERDLQKIRLFCKTLRNPKAS